MTAQAPSTTPTKLTTVESVVITPAEPGMARMLIGRTTPGVGAEVTPRLPGVGTDHREHHPRRSRGQQPVQHPAPVPRLQLTIRKHEHHHEQQREDTATRRIPESGEQEHWSTEAAVRLEEDRAHQSCGRTETQEQRGAEGDPPDRIGGSAQRDEQPDRHDRCVRKEPESADRPAPLAKERRGCHRREIHGSRR